MKMDRVPRLQFISYTKMARGRLRKLGSNWQMRNLIGMSKSQKLRKDAKPNVEGRLSTNSKSTQRE